MVMDVAAVLPVCSGAAGLVNVKTWRQEGSDNCLAEFLEFFLICLFFLVLKFS
ncbi:hypothetical protein HMPREF9371_1267 [Neisseria shayeganii 871]|uniref:Uncharacterized protein n=1 Tax=Neisseria shayeganii 871 TaxID=1032488 RepID=G4CI28_9NEIS|nr:hypothetical protein HMPREF9371_1267 [Neisseria shayeganii 871]